MLPNIGYSPLPPKSSRRVAGAFQLDNDSIPETKDNKQNLLNEQNENILQWNCDAPWFIWQQIKNSPNKFKLPTCNGTFSQTMSISTTS